MPRPTRAPAFAALALLLCAAGCGRGAPATGFEEGAAAHLRLAFAADRPLAIPAASGAGSALARARGEAHEAARELYQRRDYRTAWIGEDGPLPEAGELVAALGAAGRDGLEPAAYGWSALRGELDELAAMEGGEAPFLERAAALDLHLTEAFLTYADHLAAGRLTPAEAGVRWHTRPRRIDLPGLADHVRRRGVDEVVEALRPPHPQYLALRAARERYAELAARGGWPALPAAADGEEVVERGARGAAVEALTRRLAAGGDLHPQRAGTPIFDAAVEAALVRFQRRHGLEPDGKLGPATRAALEVPAAERMRQIELNMERWRWMPATLGRRHLAVNIAGFELQAVERGRETLSMRVVVGKAGSQTPVFSDAMRYLVFNPRWNVPEGIAHHEILPATARDPGYLASQSMELVRVGDGGEVVASGSALERALAEMRRGEGGWRIRQRSGGGNSLGRVKFMFPNRYNVYLHDTPADHLFSRAERGFSHGCVRVERPAELAAYVLADDPEWSRERVEEAIASGRTRSVPLPEPLPVHLAYWTAWVDADGRVHFRDDLYGVDAKLDRALGSAEPALTPPPPGTVRADAGAPGGSPARS